MLRNQLFIDLLLVSFLLFRWVLHLLFLKMLLVLIRDHVFDDQLAFYWAFFCRLFLDLINRFIFFFLIVLLIIIYLTFFFMFANSFLPTVNKTFRFLIFLIFFFDNTLNKIIFLLLRLSQAFQPISCCRYLFLRRHVKDLKQIINIKMIEIQ